MMSVYSSDELEPQNPSELDEPSFSEEDDIRYLHFSSKWVQGGMDLNDPSRLVFDYAQQMMAWLLFTEPPRAPLSIGVLGLGAGSLVRYPYRHMRSLIDVVEWNPQVTAACQMFFKLPASDRIGITHGDAGQWVADPANHHRCSVLMVDLYDAHARGPVRGSVEFYRQCRNVLDVGHRTGVLTVNLFGDHESFPRNINNLKTAFDGRVYLLPQTLAGNLVVLALTGPIVQYESSSLILKAQKLEEKYDLPFTRWVKTLMSPKTSLLEF